MTYLPGKIGGIAYAHGSADSNSIALPKLDQFDFYIDSNFIGNEKEESIRKPVSSLPRTRPQSRNGFSEAVRPSDYFKYFFERLKGSRGKHNILTG